MNASQPPTRANGMANNGRPPMPQEDPYPAISEYALLSDCHAAALISARGSVDWACFHRFDAPSTFARILDWQRGGYCSLAPVGAESAGRRYADATMILETDHLSGAALGRTTDLFPIAQTSSAEQAEAVHPHHQLLRIAEGMTGSTEWEFVARPRFEYGVVHPAARLLSERLALLTGGPEALSVSSSVPLELGDGEVRARFRLAEGARAWFALTNSHAHESRAESLDDGEVSRRVEHTRRFWQDWASQCNYEGPYRDAVLRSALTLKALTNAPTGAIVAAPMTSLPEAVGGERNWDYRYCWIRDATFTLYALLSLGFGSEARAFMDWIERTTAGRSEDLQVLYGVGGERLLPEVELDHLSGYRNSRPVRIGNGAARQFQLDIYGEILDTAHLWRKFGGAISTELWSFLKGCVKCIGERWRDPDEGIWEVRGGSRHFVYSKAMCWVGVDRALKIAGALGLDAPTQEWISLRDEIRNDILLNGVDADSRAFTQAYESKELDASALLLPLIGFVSHDDPRVASTVASVQDSLSKDGLVWRYVAGDGLPPGEGAFLISSFWLVDNLAILGRTDEARELFERLCGLSNDVGLFAEEYDPDTGEHLGNFPQAFTHMALITSALNLGRGGGPVGEGERPCLDPDQD